MVRSDTSLLALIQRHGPPVQQALIARYGLDVGQEVAAEVVAWAWEHGTEVEQARNPAGLLFRVGQSKARRLLRWRRTAPPGDQVAAASFPDLDLQRALTALRPEHRTVVLLVHAYGFTYRAAAELLDVSEATVRNQLHRAMTQLRLLMKEDSGA